VSWILHFFGIEPRSPSTAYNFWSGSGSDIGELAIIGAILGTYHRHNCHAKGCWRIARQQIHGTTLLVCRKHHPDDAPTDL
jgi:hypothetical protein